MVSTLLQHQVDLLAGRIRLLLLYNRAVYCGNNIYRQSARIVVFLSTTDGHDKAKPLVRRGRKATGLEKKTAGLPKDDVFGLIGILIGMLNLLITVLWGDAHEETA